MIDMFINFWEWFVKQWEPVFTFLRENRNNAFLWIGLFVVGMLLVKITYDVLHRNNK